MSAPDPDTFLSGTTGETAGIKRTVLRTAGDAALDLLWRGSGSGRTLDRLAEDTPSRRVLVLSLYRAGSALPSAVRELTSSRHEMDAAFGAIGPADPELADSTVASDLDGGKFENLNCVLREVPDRERFDWTLVVDDDVRLPERFLDRFLAVCERLRLDIAQPAQTLRSHAAWEVTRRRPASLARETRFVEIGPVTAFRRAPAAELMPFPELRYGWGLDLHWAAVAEDRGWRRGVVDALPVRHEDAPVAASYPIEEAKAEAARFLSDRPYLSSHAAAETVAVHRRIRG